MCTALLTLESVYRYFCLILAVITHDVCYHGLILLRNMTICTALLTLESVYRYFRIIKKQSLYRPVVAQRVPGS